MESPVIRGMSAGVDFRHNGSNETSGSQTKWRYDEVEPEVRTRGFGRGDLQYSRLTVGARAGLADPSHSGGIGARSGGRAVAACARQGYSETAVLVDVDGVRQAVLRGDHTLDKAYTAASFKSDTSALVERAKTVPITPLLAKLPNLLLIGGGLVIKIDDEVVGAIGAAGAPGGDLDDACARAGLDKIRDHLK
jgi:uncharacterized protein GlcG (DUF336 family)